MQHSFLVCSVLLVGSMALPRFGGPEHLWVNGLYESFCILALFPVIVALGAGHKDAAGSNQICRVLGNLSYPLYITHYPLVYLYTAWMWRGPHSLLQRIGWGVLLWCTAVLFAYGCLKLYDEPVRAWLSQRLLSKTRPRDNPRTPGEDPALLGS